MKRSRIRILRTTVVLVVIAAAGALVAVPASAAAATVTGTITRDPVAPGVNAQLGFSIMASSRTLQSFTLTPPSGWVLRSVDSQPSTGEAHLNPNNQIEATGLSVSGPASASILFTVGTGCGAGDWDWTLVAKDSQGRTYGNDSSDLTTKINGSCHLAIGPQPMDARAGETITNSRFDPSGTEVAVELRNSSETVVDYFPVTVGFDLLLTGEPAPGLSITPQLTTAGVATFSTGTLSVTKSNDAQFTDYTLIPASSDYPVITGDPSDPFDIWEAACRGACTASLQHGKGSTDDYSTDAAGVFLSASTLQAGGQSNGLFCEGQKVIFNNNVFVYEGGAGTAVFLRSHITKADYRTAGTNFGQAHVVWCMGLELESDWTSIGVSDSVHEDTNGDGEPDLWVHGAPACPSKNPQNFAPCITHQSSDGQGGGITEGWLPGVDPRRGT